jgi:NAD-dependent dihydropyrimidine dehydrogenase PreA subunit
LRLINLLAELIEENCTGCTICEKVCPTLAITMIKNEPDRKPKNLPLIDTSTCVGCWACEQRCPDDALRMVKHPEPYTVGVSLDGVDYAEVEALCRKAKLHPEQVICFCTVTRADEVAAGILKGHTTPEALSYWTGIRTGCKVECTQPLLRLVEASGHKLEPVKNGWQWMGRTPTVWEIPEEIKQKYASRGFYFDEDIKLMDEIINSPVAQKKEEE